MGGAAQAVKLSVIVPVYNMAGDGKLEYCLDSLLAQTVEDYEIIAVNDASTDNSLEILRAYEKRCPRLKVLTYPDNRRQGGAKNEGLRAARGEWIGFIDSDDWVTPDFYEKLLRKAEETGADLVGCDYQLVGRHSMEPGRRVENNQSGQTGPLDTAKHKLHLLQPGSMVVKIYRAKVIFENRLEFPEGIFYEDNCAGPLWSLYFRHFERVPEPLYYYYQHDASTVHVITEEKCRDRMTAAVRLYEECRERGFLEPYHDELESRFTEIYYVNTLFSYLSGVERPNLAFLRELRSGMRERFPAFRRNPYYAQRVGEVEREMIALFEKSTGLFLLYYRFRQLVWKWKRKGKS